MNLVERVYAVTQNFPSEEKFGLISQMRRAAVSVPSNIAEGAADRTTNQFANFLSNALGSLAELDTQVELSLRLGFMNEDEYRSVSEVIDRSKGLVFGLRKSLRK
jgi:four helix bundle protein